LNLHRSKNETPHLLVFFSAMFHNFKISWEVTPSENGDDEIPLGYTYDYGGVAKTYKPSKDIKINIEEGSILHNDQMTDM
jgi:hypothetical protein